MSERLGARGAQRGRRRAVNRRVLAIQLVTGLAVLAVWEVIGRAGLFADHVLPPFSAVMASLVRLLGSAEVWFDVQVTVWEIGFGLLIGLVVGLAVGVGVGASEAAWRTVEPLVFYVSSLPKIILLPVLVLFLGAGEYSKVGMGALSAVFPIVVTTAVGIRQVRQVHLQAARTLGAGLRQIVFKIFFPATVGPVLVGVRLGFGVAVTGTLLAETAVASAGIGFRAISYYANLQIEDMYALLLVVFLAAVTMNVLLGVLLRRLTRYTRAASTEVMA